MKKLLLGCGDWDWPDYIRLDASMTSKATVICTFPPLPRQVDGMTFSEILCVHTIEHLAPWKAEELLRICYDVLEPDGVLILEQPNILYCAEILLGIRERPEEEFEGQYDMAGFYGDPNHKDELMLHRWGWHPNSLQRALARAGFGEDKITRLPTQFHGSRLRDFRLEARK